MKTVRCLITAAVACVALALRAVGDDPMALQSDATVNPHAQEDPDGVPLAVVDGNKGQPAQPDAAARQKAQEEENQNKDWLLRDYEQQLQSHLGSQGGDKSGNLYYYQIISDKNLAKFAGQPVLKSTTPESVTNFRTGTAHAAQDDSALRTDASLKNAKPPLTAFKPLIIPLGATDAAGLHNFYNSLSAPLLPATNPAKADIAPSTNQASDPSAMETPGLTAAESDPMRRGDSLDLTLDLPPSEDLPQDKPHSMLELPLGKNVDRMHNQDNASLNTPGAVKTAQPTPVNPVLIKLPEELEPVQIAPPAPMHPIADPRDIFYR